MTDLKTEPREIVRFLRDDLNMTEAEIAKKIGVSQSQVNKIHSGRRENIGYKTVDKLRDFYKSIAQAV